MEAKLKLTRESTEVSPPERTLAPAVRLLGVSKTYPGDATALSDVSLEIAEGEFFAILGPSGSGKTTTLKLIGGFERPSAGDIWIGGVLMGDRPPFQRNVNTVFQHYALFPHLDVFGNVAFGPRMHGVARRDRAVRVSRVLALVQLEHLARRRVSQLSGGEQQRVALARALVNEPAVLLLDEPLGSLDLKLRKEMQRELKALQERIGITFIHVTHDQEEAITMADRVAVFHRGKVMQVGKPSELYENPANRFVATFVGDVNVLEGTAGAQRGASVEIEVVGLGRVVAQPSAGAPAPGPGSKVAVALRPERVDLVLEGTAPPGLDGGADLAGTVVRTTYRGAEVRHEVRLSNGAMVLADVPVYGSESRVLEAGAAVRVRWALGAARVVAD